MNSQNNLSLLSESCRVAPLAVTQLLTLRFHCVLILFWSEQLSSLKAFLHHLFVLFFVGSIQMSLQYTNPKHVFKLCPSILSCHANMVVLGGALGEIETDFHAIRD